MSADWDSPALQRHPAAIHPGLSPAPARQPGRR